MKSFPQPLTASEEREYMQRYTEGDLEAKHILIERNLRLVAHIVKKYQTCEEETEDLLSIGTIGLIKAVVTFNPEKCVRLGTYAARCIENEILMYLRRLSGRRTEVSLDEPLSADWDGNELLLGDILGTEPDSVLRPLEDDADRALLREALGRLPAREKRIISMRFGIGLPEPMTQKEVADCMGISQSYISRLEKRILARMRREMQQHYA